MSTKPRRCHPLFGTALFVSLATACSPPPTPPTDATADAALSDENALQDSAVTDAPVAIDVVPDAGFVCTRPNRRARDAGTDAGPAVDRCNGSSALCGRRFDRVAYATTHNGMSNADDNWIAPNQTHGIERQLRDGIRGLMLDTHEYRRDTWLCHGDCLFGKRLLADGLCAITRFLDENPGEVVTLIFESYISADQAEEAFRRSGLIDYVHAHPLGAPWPTLGEMVSRDERLVAFSAREGGARPWYHDYFAHAFENPYAARTPGELSCAVDRGSASNSLFVLNHFLTAPLADIELARMINPDPFFTNRVRQCTAERGRPPNFVTVDFYDVGALMPVVEALNNGAFAP